MLLEPYDGGINTDGVESLSWFLRRWPSRTICGTHKFVNLLWPPDRTLSVILFWCSRRNLREEEEKGTWEMKKKSGMKALNMMLICTTYMYGHVPIPLTTLCIHNIHVYRRAVFLHEFLGIDMLKSNEKFSTIHVYTILYVCVPHYTKIKSKQKFKIRNIKISLPTVILLYIHTYYMIHYILLPHI